ncbi:MAG TPA: hypothetical protein VF624_11825 [Tepidisphaeraceae bacterium]|jgi:hypothetical protein
MKSKLVLGLVILNLVLLTAFLGRVWPGNIAQAQQARRPGEYLMIPAEVQGGQAGVVFIIDTNSGELSAIALDEGTKKLVAMPRINLGDMFVGGDGPAREPRRK